MTEHPNPNTAEVAEDARQQREHDEPGKVRVKVGDAPVAVGDKLHAAGATFTADEATINQALAHGLLEKIEPKGKRR